jgi:hypothetical protein
VLTNGGVEVNGCGGRSTRGWAATGSGVLAAIACVLVLGLMLVPVAWANSGMRMTPLLTRVQLRHGHISAMDLRGSRRARTAIVGGSHISILQAPWQVVVIAVLSRTEALLCGGAILNETEVLTAGHCVYNPGTREQVPADQIVVGAGTADLYEEEPGEEASLAGGVRVHPDYVYDPEATQAVPDDVAVLKLEDPLVLGASAQAINLTPANTLLQEGTSVNLTGFGKENPTEELDGELHSIGMTLGFSRECGGEDDALFLCASTPTGSDCFGDSGSALTVSGLPATLVGVTDTTEVIDGKPCLDGSVGGFANVAAPEIRDFIVEDNMDPPLAPRGGGTSLNGVSTVGDTLRCEPGFWSNSPSFTYIFIDSADGQILQQGSSSAYMLSSTDAGDTILCQVLAANAGGTGIGRTKATSPVQRTLREEDEEAAVKKKQEEEAVARKKHEQEAAINKKQEEEATAAAASKKQEEEAAAIKKHQEEEATAAVVKKHQEEEAAKGGVLGAKESSPDATIASTSLTVSASGVVNLEISCPAGESGCAGMVTLRTLDAVSARVAGTAKMKATVLTLAAGSFTVPGGKAKTVTLHLSAKARALLARSHVLRVRATIIAHNPAGGTHTGQAIVTLRAPRAKHR